MSTIIQRLSLVTACLLSAILACVLFVRSNAHLVPVVRAQDEQPAGSKMIDIDPPFVGDAVKIVRISVGKTEVAPGFHMYSNSKWPATPFQAGEDWLENLSFVIRNEASKTIEDAEMSACFPDEETKSLLACIPIQLGRIPANAAYTGNGLPLHQGARRPIHFAPGQEMTISLAEYSDAIRERIEDSGRPFSRVNKCWIVRDMFYFDDGTMWDRAGYWMPDPEHPGWPKLVERTNRPAFAWRK